MNRFFLSPKLLSLLGALITSFMVSGQFAFEGPIPPITSGYGAFGDTIFTSEFFYLPPDTSLECQDTIHGIITYPVGMHAPRPVVFRFPGASNENLSDSVYFKESQFYREFVASHGYVSVTMQWNYDNSNNYGCAYQMVEDIAAIHADKIDTTRVGIHGMSAGAAMSNWLGLKKFASDNWGTNGRFLWPDAGASFIGFISDWPNDIATQTDSGLAAMPDDVLYLMTLSEWDQTPDPRMCIDMFNFMGVPDSNKEFIIIRGDTLNSYIYWATHFTTNTWENDSNQFNVYITKHDALDYWLGTRLLHSLMQSAWFNDPVARRICMGDGDTLQTQIAGGAIRGPIVTDQPWMTMFSSWNSGQGYMNPCTVSWNMRQYVTADACFLLDVPEFQDHPEVNIFPNPTTSSQPITIQSNKEIVHLLIVNENGQSIAEYSQPVFELQNAGMYFLGITFENGQKTAVKLTVVD